MTHQRLTALTLAVCLTASVSAQNPAAAQPQQQTMPAPAPASGPVVGEIAGVVKAGSTPLPGVTITASNTLTGRKVFTSTDAEGRYALKVTGKGRYVIKAELPAFAAATKEAVVNEATPTHTIDLEMMLFSRAQAQQEQQAQQQQQAINALAGRGFQSLGLTQNEGAGEMGSPAAGSNGSDTGMPAAAMGGDAATESVSIAGNMGQTQQLGFDSDAMQERIQEMRERMERGDMSGGGIMGGGGGPGIMMIGGGGGGPISMGGGGGQVFVMGGPGGGGGGRGGRGGRGGFNINQPHGMINWNYGAAALDARPYSLTGVKAAKPEYTQNRIMASIGGPLNIPKIYQGGTKTFYFLNYFANIASNPFDNFYTVPTALERAGDFSQTLQRSGPNAGQPVVIYDPTTGLPFANNQIPAGRLSAAALGLLRFLPTSNQGGTVQNFHRVASSDSIAHNINFRLVHNLASGGGGGRGGAYNPMAALMGGRNSLNFGFNYRNSDTDINNFSPELGGAAKSNGMNVNAAWVKGIGKVTNRLGFNFNHNETRTANLYAGVENIEGNLGIGGVSTDPFDWGAPSLSFTNLSGVRDVNPTRRTDNSWQISDSASLRWKKHNLRFGGEYRRTQLGLRSNPNPRGTFTFTGFSTAQTTLVGGQTVRTPGTGYDFADFLLGLPQQTSLQFGAAGYQFNGNNYSFFFQDDWRVHNKLTLNLGLRYEYVGPLTEENNRLVNLDAAGDFTAVAPVFPEGTGAFTGKFPKSLVNPDRNNFAPRVGLAWNVLPKTVVRAGYGVNYNVGAYSSFVQQLAFQPPFSNTSTNVTSAAQTLTLTNGFPVLTGVLTNNFGVDRDYVLGYVQNWNASVQRELPWGLQLNASYNGAKGSHLDMQRAPNRTPTGLRIPGVQAFLWQSAEGASIYHGGTLRLRKRMQKGIAVGGSYTYSKSIDNASNIGGGASVVAQNDLDLAGERGLSSFDQRHRGTIDYTIDLPFGTNKKWLNNTSAGAHIFGDWTIQGFINARSGSPFTPRVIGAFTDVSAGVNGTLRANVTGAPLGVSDPTIARWFNTGAFVAPPAGQFGNARRNSIEGPGAVTVDLTLNKNIPLKDMKAIGFRVMMNNIFNHANYSSIDTAVNSPSYGRVTGVASMRRIQFNTSFRF